MADTKISGLTQASDARDADEFVVNASGTSKKALGAQLRALLSTAARVTLPGTARYIGSDLRLTVADPAPAFRGAYGLGSVSIRDDEFLLQYSRASLAGRARATLVGTGELFLFSLAPAGRIVLAGRGG